MSRLCVRSLILPVMMVLLAALWANAGPAGAAEEAQPTRLDVASYPMMDEQGDEVPGKFWITVSLTTEDGRYVANRPLKVVEPVDFFGRREAVLGTTVTDGTGMAAVTYQPSHASVHTVVVRFPGDNEYAASKAELVIEVTDALSPFPEEGIPLASVGTGLAIFLALLGIAFWVVLFGVVARTVWRIRGAVQTEPV